MDARYNLIFQKYYQKISDRNIFEVRDFFLIRAFLYQEPPSFDNIKKYMNSNLTEYVSIKDILDRSKTLRLTPAERAEQIFNDAKKSSQLINELLDSPPAKERQELYFKIRESIIPKLSPIFSKAILVCLLDSSNGSSHSEFLKNFKEIIQKISTKNSHYLLKDIVNTIADIIGIKRNDDDEKDDLKTALDISKQEIDSLKEEISDIRDGKITDAIVTFFKELNSAQNNYLLDQFSISAATIKKLKKEKYKFPDQLGSIPVNIRMFMKFVYNLGVTPIANIGDKLTIDLEKSENYEYIGTPFEDSNEKMVLITKPGWKYADIIISKPEVKEIIEIETKEGE